MSEGIKRHMGHNTFIIWLIAIYVCGTLKCENAAICEKVAKCEKMSTLNVKIDAICAKITLNVNKWGSLNVTNIFTLNVLKSTLYVQTLIWRYLWKSNFNTCQISPKCYNNFISWRQKIRYDVTIYVMMSKSVYIKTHKMRHDV